METQPDRPATGARVRLGLFWQILLATLLVSIVPLVLVSLTSFNAIEGTGEQAAEVAVSELDRKSIEALRVRAEQTASQISAFLDVRVADTQYAAMLPPTTGAYLSFYRSHKSDLWFLRGSPEAPVSDQIKRMIPTYHEMAFIDASGQELIHIVDGTLVPQEQLRNVADPANTTYLTETYFGQAKDLPRDEVYVSPVTSWYVMEEAQPAQAVDAETSQYEYINYEAVIHFATPTFDESGQFNGVVVLTLDHRHIMEFSNHILSSAGQVIWPSYASGNYAYLLDYQGWLIAHPNLTAVRGLGENGELKPTQTRAGLDAGDSLPLNMLQSDIKEQALIIASAVLTGQSGDIQAKNLEGATKVDIYVPIPFSHGVYQENGFFGGLVISENVNNVEQAGRISTSSIADSTRLMRGNIAWIMGISIVALVLVAILLSRNITLPISKLTNAARVMEKGELDVETLDRLLEPKIENEVTDLTRVFKQMAKAVQLRERRLKQEVRELKIQIDKTKREHEVKQIVETEFFEDLQAKARALRQRRDRKPD